MSVTIKDNTDEVCDGIGSALERALTRIGLQAEAYAKKACPVDTGNLKNSITNEVVMSEKAAYIGTNVEYAPYVELGTRKSRAQPFLEPAATQHSDTYKRILEDEMKNG